jgi:hypothetical protein
VPYKFFVDGTNFLSNAHQTVFVVLILQHNTIFDSFLAETSPHLTHPSYFAVLNPVIFLKPRRRYAWDVVLNVNPDVLCFLMSDFLPLVDRLLLWLLL